MCSIYGTDVYLCNSSLVLGVGDTYLSILSYVCIDRVPVVKFRVFEFQQKVVLIKFTRPSIKDHVIQICVVGRRKNPQYQRNVHPKISLPRYQSLGYSYETRINILADYNCLGISISVRGTALLLSLTILSRVPHYEKAFIQVMKKYYEKWLDDKDF